MATLPPGTATTRMLERRGYNFSLGLAQVNRQLPSAEAAVLCQHRPIVGYATSTARRKSAACLLGSVRQPA